MAGLIKWYWQSLFAGPRPPNLPPPIPFHQGCVGGIETIVIDGKHWFYGYEYRGQSIVTPLIDDADTMAAFASWYMRPYEGGARDPQFWREVVEKAVAEPELAGDGAAHTFTTAGFQHIAVSLAAAEADNLPVPGFSIPYHLLFLLAVARGHELPSDTSSNAGALAKLGLSEIESDVTNAQIVAEMLAGSEPLQEGATYADAAAFLRGCLTDWISRCPANWTSVFQDLIKPQPNA